MPGTISFATRRTPSSAGRQRGQESRSQARHRWQLEQQLQHARDEHADGQRQARVAAVLGDGQCDDDQHDVHHHLRERRDEEAPMAVEHAGEQRGHRDEEQVGEGPAQHLHCQAYSPVPVTAHLGANSRMITGAAITPAMLTRNSTAPRVPATPEISSRTSLVLALHLELGNHRDEGLRERTLGEQPAQEIGDLEGHQEGVRHRADTQGLGHEGVTQQAGDPRQEGGKPGGRGVLQQGAAHRVGQRIRAPRRIDARSAPG